MTRCKHTASQQDNSKEEQDNDMAIIQELRGVTPVIGERAFLAENAAIIGSVKMGDDCSIWYGAVLRGDVGPITRGDRVNIQDGAVLHATTDVSEVIIGNDVSVGRPIRRCR